MTASSSSKQTISMEEWESKLAEVPIAKSDLNQLIMNYLIIEGYKDAAEKFSEESGLHSTVDLGSIEERMQIRFAIQNGDIKSAIERVNDLNPDLLDTDPRLYFHLQQQQLIELIRQGKAEEALEFAQEELAPHGEEHPELLRELERTMALLAFDNVTMANGSHMSPLADLLDFAHRQKTANELNAALLAAHSQPKEPKLPALLQLLAWTQDQLDKKATYPRINNIIEAVLEGPATATTTGGNNSNSTATRPCKMAASVERATTPYTRHFYPVLGVLNAPRPLHHSKNATAESTLQLTPYARQVGRSILKYIGGNANSTAPSPLPSSPIADSANQHELVEQDETTSKEDQSVSGWDPVGPSRAPRWQTVAFDRVDDIPRRKAWRQGASDNSAEETDLSPRRADSELWGEGLMMPQWIAKQQQRRPATVISLHALHQGSPGGARGAAGSLGGSDTLLAEELARNRICLAAFGLTYMAVVIINRALAEDDPKGTEARLTAIMQRSGLDQQSQFAVCRPGSAQQFQRFVDDLERKLFTRAAAYYADSFVRTQKKMVAIPQLPVPATPDRPDAVYRSLYWSPEARAATGRLLESDRSLIAKYSRFLPLRAWLARYHFKLSVFAECAGDRDTAHRCLWMAYLHLLCYVAEIACGAYLPPNDSIKSQTAEPVPPRGWMWALSGGDSDGQRAHNMRMFGKRWTEAIELLDAIHLRLVRGWLYQSLDLAALRAKNHQSVFSASGASSSSGWAAYGFGQQRPQQPFVVAPINRTGTQGTGGGGGGSANGSSTALGMVPSSPRSPGMTAPGANNGGSSVGAIAGISGTNGCLEPLVFSVHAGEASAATEQLMQLERARRADPNVSSPTSPETDSLVYYVALGSETVDVDLLQPVVDSKVDEELAVAAVGWWSLGGMYGVLDFSKPPQQQQQQQQPPPLYKRRDTLTNDRTADMRSISAGLVLNSSLDVACASLMLPQSNQYDQCLTMAARQCAEHIVAMARVLTAGGFDDSSSYFWACIARQYCNHAALYQLATDHGLGFAHALNAMAMQRTPADAHGRQLLESLVQSLRSPRLRTSGIESETTAGAVCASKETTRPRALSTAFTGFAFDQALGSVYAVASGRSSSSNVLSPGRTHRTTTGGCVFPQWMWPENAAPLFHAASLASVRQRQQFLREERVYLSGDTDDSHMVCATPGVANTYAAMWLVPERKALAEATYGDTACVLLLASALRSLANVTENAGPAAAEIVSSKHNLRSVDDTLVRLIRDDRRASATKSSSARSNHMCLFLASQLAEMYANSGLHARALEIFALLADRFRAEGWALLTGHALQWVLRCSSAEQSTGSVGNSSSASEVRAMLELLSPHVVACDKERSFIADDFMRHLAQTTELLGADEPSQQADRDPLELKIDMTHIYSPVTCHAHWRHWRLGTSDATHMAFQVAVDCRDIAVPLALSELSVRIGSSSSSSSFDVQVLGDASAGAAAKDVSCADGQSIRFYDVGTVGGGSAATVRGLRLELNPRCITVFEGRVSLADDDLQALHPSSSDSTACSSVILDSVSLYIATGGEWRLRLFWPTCASPTTTSGESIATTPGQPMSLASTHPSSIIQQQDGAEDATLNQIERLLLCNIGITRMQEGNRELGSSSQLTLPSVGASEEDVALRKAICIAGPAASLPKQLLRKWLYITPQGNCGRWVQLPMPPLAPDTLSIGGGDDTTQSNGDSNSMAEPTVSAYSRCRAVHLPNPEPALSIDVGPIATLAPAYRGEAFPVRVVVANTHRSRTVARIEVAVTLEESSAHADARGSMSDLDVAGDMAPGASSRTSFSNTPVFQTAGGTPPLGTVAPTGGASGAMATGRIDSPWLSMSNKGSSANMPKDPRPQHLCIDINADTGTKELAPKNSHATTLYVHFPSSALESAAEAAHIATEAEATVSLVFTARYVFSDDSRRLDPDNGGNETAAQWSGQTTIQTSIPVVRHLFAHAEALPLPAPFASTQDSRLMEQPVPVSLPATGLSAAGEYCFRRPVRVTLVNRGPWAVVVERVLLRPPLIEAAASVPMRVQLAGSSAHDTYGSLVVAPDGGTLKHVFWLDIHTTDVIRMPTAVCPGMLEIQWHRVELEPPGVATTELTRLWLPPLELVRKQVQVDMEASMPMAQVGQPLTVCYRVLNPTRVVQTVDTTMHASDAFVFSGLRKTTLAVLPGHVGLLRFNLLPTMASQQRAAQDPSLVDYAPGHPVLALMTHGMQRNGGHYRRLAGSSALPQSNLSGLGWTILPRLDVRIAGTADTSTNESGSVIQPSPQQPALRPRGMFSPVVPPPPPSRVTLSSAIDGSSLVGLDQMTRCAQNAIVALAGLENGGLNEAPDSVKDLLTPELARSCLDMVPDYCVHSAEAGWTEAVGAESDIDSDTEDVQASMKPSADVRGASIDTNPAAEESSDVVLRYDQTTIFCAP
ncbi:hypothetical protein EV179_003143 [Coemansia sp. RSA 487]|nr:hypothetical protein EV179_003143 [Coemansia sp. RSA 487]